MALATASRIGPYEIVSALGAGGMGEVYRAHDVRLGRDVALKLLPERLANDPNRLARLRREARILAALNHPHIATLYGLEEKDGALVLVMELVEGQTLSERLRAGPLGVPEALDCAIQIAAALEAAHEIGILHRDLKPANVRLTAKGQLKLLDFGLARAFAESGPRGETVEHPSTLPTEEAPGADSRGASGTAPYMSPEQARGETLDRRTDVWAFGCVLFEMLSGHRAFAGASAADAIAAVLEKDPPWPALPAHVPAGARRLLERCLQKDKEKRLRDIGQARLEIEDLRLGCRRDGRVAARSPYPGLRFFTEEEASRFFGRESEVEALWGKLQAHRLLAVIGPSGAGKTSFVRAGVVASRPQGWGGLVCTPGARPFGALAQALAPHLAGDAGAIVDLLRFEAAERALAAVSRWRHAHAGALLVVDQFEELFTLNPPEVQARFAELLGRIANDADVHVLLSMRDDFLFECHGHPALEPVFEGLTPIGPPSGPALRRALVEPARRAGYRFEDAALVDEMLGCVAEGRGALPLLAFAAARLWESGDAERALLTRAAYERIGGVAGALAQHAEATLEAIGAEREGVVRELFRNLVTAEGTRAVIDREELLSVFGNGRAEAARVLDTLVDARLVTQHEATLDRVSAASGQTPPAVARHRNVEIVHESLLVAWPRLVRWQTQDADGAQLRDQLRQAAHLWDEKGRSADLLWTGTAEREFELWRERYPGTLSAVEDDFARAMVERALRRKRLRRVAVVSVLGVAGLVAAVTASLWLRSEAALERAAAAALRSEASRVLALAQLRLQVDPTEALALATASLELADSEEARLFVVKALAEAPPALELAAGVGVGVRVPVFSPDGRWLAAAGHSARAFVWTEAGEPVATLPGHGLSPRGSNIARWSSPRLLVSGLGNFAESLQVWSLPAGTRLRTIDLGGESAWQVSGDRVLTETIDRAGVRVLRSWPLPEGEATILGRVDLAGLRASRGRLSPDGSAWVYARESEVRLRPLAGFDSRDRLLTRHAAEVVFLGPGMGPNQLLSRDATGETRVLDLANTDAPRVEVIPRPASATTMVFPEPSGRWLVGETMKQTHARVWNRASWPVARPLALRRNVSWYGAGTAFHPSGDWLVASTENFMNLTFWPLREPRPTIADGYSQLLRPLAFSPDGRWLVTSWGDEQLRLWPLGARMREDPRVLSAPGRYLWADATFDPQSQLVFAVTTTGGACAVPLDGSPPVHLPAWGPDALLYTAAVSPSGRQVATAFGFGRGDKVLRLWNLATGAQRRLALPPAAPSMPDVSPIHDRGINTLVFASESVLYSAGDGGIRRWNLENGTQELVYPAKPGHAVTAAFSADRHTAIVRQWRASGETSCRAFERVDLSTRTGHELPRFGTCGPETAMHLDRSGTVAATGDRDGLVRVGRLADGEPHILAGHEGTVQFVAISPDLKWVASSGEDNTLRLWPMPDLDRPPLHTLPHGDLLATLRSLTNFRAVRDPAAPNGWRIEIGPFPGWRHVPTW